MLAVEVGMMCKPTDHDFKHGGVGDDVTWEAWLFCGKCGAIAMVPTDADKGALLIAAGTNQPTTT